MPLYTDKKCKTCEEISIVIDGIDPEEPDYECTGCIGGRSWRKQHEEIYMARCEPGWGEQQSSNLDEITEYYTPELIHAALISEIPSHTPSIEKIEAWLKENRETTLNNNRKSLFLYADEECPHCGHDPDQSYELTYYWANGTVEEILNKLNLPSTNLE